MQTQKYIPHSSGEWQKELEDRNDLPTTLFAAIVCPRKPALKEYAFLHLTGIERMVTHETV